VRIDAGAAAAEEVVERVLDHLGIG
jgi:hypothetical protein